MGDLSKRFNTRWKRATFVILCLPFIGLLLSFFAILFFWQSVYFPSDESALYNCHRETAMRELGISNIFAMSAPQQRELYSRINSRLDSRFSHAVRRIETSSAFHDCLRTTWSGANLMNFEFAKREALHFLIFSLLSIVIMLSLNRVEAMVRWVLMK